MDGLREDLAVCNAGYDAEREEKAAVEAARDEASKQLEFLEAELEGVRAEESALRADVKVKTEELSDLTSARDELDDEVRRLKELSNAREIECTKLRSQLSELREQHSVALDDARRYQAESERQGERAGKLAAQTSAAMSEADKLRKWQDWAKSSEVTSLQSELEVVKQERDMLQRDLQSRLAEMRRVTQQNEEWGRDVKALRADLFARGGWRWRRSSRRSKALDDDRDGPVRREGAGATTGEELQVAAMDAVEPEFETERLKISPSSTDARRAKRRDWGDARETRGGDGGGETRRGGGGDWRRSWRRGSRNRRRCSLPTTRSSPKRWRLTKTHGRGTQAAEHAGGPHVGVPRQPRLRRLSFHERRASHRPRRLITRSHPRAPLSASLTIIIVPWRRRRGLRPPGTPPGARLFQSRTFPQPFARPPAPPRAPPRPSRPPTDATHRTLVRVRTRDDARDAPTTYPRRRETAGPRVAFRNLKFRVVAAVVASSRARVPVPARLEEVRTPPSRGPPARSRPPRASVPPAGGAVPASAPSLLLAPAPPPRRRDPPPRAGRRSRESPPRQVRAASLGRCGSSRIVGARRRALRGAGTDGTSARSGRVRGHRRAARRPWSCRRPPRGPMSRA